MPTSWYQTSWRWWWGEGWGLWHQWADLLISVVYIYNWYILISHFSPIDIRPSLTFSNRDSIFHMKCLGGFLQFIKANSYWLIIHHLLFSLFEKARIFARRQFVAIYCNCTAIICSFLQFTKAFVKLYLYLSICIFSFFQFKKANSKMFIMEVGLYRSM